MAIAYPGNTTPQNADDQQLTLKKILLALIGGGPGGAIPVNPSGGFSAPPAAANSVDGNSTSTGSLVLVDAAHSTGTGMSIVNTGSNTIKVTSNAAATFADANGVLLAAGKSISRSNRVAVYVIDDGSNHSAYSWVSEYN